MTRKPNRRYILSIRNPDLLRSPIFMQACGESLPMLAIICEWAFESGFVDLQEAYVTAPKIIETMCDRARMALRGLQKLERWEKRRTSS